MDILVGLDLFVSNLPKVLEEIGKGVYGSVCRAEHLQSQHVVAIKILGGEKRTHTILWGT